MIFKTCIRCLRVYRGKREIDNCFHADGRGGYRNICKECRSNERKGEPLVYPDFDPNDTIEKAQTYVITWAQNATKIFEPFLQALKVYCKQHSAELVVIAGKYQNHIFKMHERVWYDGRLDGHLFYGEEGINSNLRIYGDIKILPTRKRPLSGLESHIRRSSGIFGHTKQEWITRPTANRSWPRFLLSTGAITVPEYNESAAGKTAEKHHTYGALVVQKLGRKFFARHVTADPKTGEFQDLNTIYSKSGTRKGRVLGLVCADLHAEYEATQAVKATFGEGGVVETLCPENIFYHDVFSMRARSKHNISAQERYERFWSNTNDVEADLKKALHRVLQYTPEDAKGYIVDSNHHHHLDHWLNNCEIKTDPVNARLYHSLWLKIIDNYHAINKMIDPYILWTEDELMALGVQRIKCLRGDDRIRVGGVDCAFHGHRGPNGTRGSIGKYAKMGGRYAIGHSHTPGKMDGALTVGSMSLDQGYNALPSSWFTAHGLIYETGADTLLPIIDDKWRV